MNHRATEIDGVETTNNWRFFRLSKGGPLSVDSPVDVIVSVPLVEMTYGTTAYRSTGCSELASHARPVNDD